MSLKCVGSVELNGPKLESAEMSYAAETTTEDFMRSGCEGEDGNNKKFLIVDGRRVQSTVSYQARDSRLVQ